MTAAALAQLGVATIYEASGRTGLVDADLLQIISDSRVAGPASTVLPIWTRWIRATGADKQIPGQLNTTVLIEGQPITPGDYLIMEADGAVIVTEHRLAQVTEAAARRSEHEQTIRERLATGELTLDLLALRPEPESLAPTNPRPTPISAGPWLRSRTPPPNDRGATCRQQLKSPTNG